MRLDRSIISKKGISSSRELYWMQVSCEWIFIIINMSLPRPQNYLIVLLLAHHAGQHVELVLHGLGRVHLPLEHGERLEGQSQVQQWGRAKIKYLFPTIQYL